MFREPANGSLATKMASKDTEMDQRAKKWPKMTQNLDEGRCHVQKWKYFLGGGVEFLIGDFENRGVGSQFHKNV